MLDAVTINQLRTFVAVCDEASFSKASRRLMRAQSAVSHAIAALEEGLGVTLFSRDGHKPELTPAGRLLLADARVVIANAEELKNRARSIAESGPQELVVAVDPNFPRARLVQTLSGLRAERPTLQVKLFIQMPRKSETLVVEGRSGLALVTARSPVVDAGRLERRPVCAVPFVTVCAAGHPLARLAGAVSKVELARHTQVVATDPDSDADKLPTCAIGESAWYVADLAAAHEFVAAGLGWAHLPLETVADDLASHRLTALSADREGADEATLPFAMSSLRGRRYSACEERFLALLRGESIGDAATTTRPAFGSPGGRAA